MRYFNHLISSECLINILMLAVCSGLACGLWNQADMGLNLWGNIT